MCYIPETEVSENTVRKRQASNQHLRGKKNSSVGILLLHRFFFCSLFCILGLCCEEVYISVSVAEMFDYFSAGPSYLRKVVSQSLHKVGNRQEFVVPVSSITNVHLFSIYIFEMTGNERRGNGRLRVSEWTTAG